MIKSVSLLLSVVSVVMLTYFLVPSMDAEVQESAGPNFSVAVRANVPPLCEGECTTLLGGDILLDIENGTAPFSFTSASTWNLLAPNNTINYARTNLGIIHAIRICHNPSVTEVEIEELASDITVFNVPTAAFPGEIFIQSVEDITGCQATITQSLMPIRALQGTYIDYQADIPDIICDSLVLPEIQPFTAGAAYYTEPQGMGTKYESGDLLNFTTINLPNGDLLDSLYIFDPTDLCESEKLYTFMIQPSPNHTVLNDTISCGEVVLPAFSGPVTTPSAQYASSADFEANSLLSPGDVISTNQTIFIADTAQYQNTLCTFLDSFRIEVVTEPNAGLDTTLIVCQGEQTIITDLLSLLPGADSGGIWSGSNIPDFDYNNPVDLDLSHMTSGLSYSLNYTIERPGCPIANANVMISAVAAPFAGDSTEIFLCSGDGPQDFFELLNFPDQGGQWDLNSGQLLAFTDYSNADFFGLPDDQYIFTYTLEATNACPEKTAELIINLSSGTNAGQDNAALVCLGDSLDLNQLLSPEALPGGRYIVDGFIPLSGETWSSNGILIEQGQNSRDVIIEYILDGTSSSCPADTATFTITVIEEPFAGFPITAVSTQCAGDELVLADLIDAENTGGQFYDATDYSIAFPDVWTVSNTPRSIAYVVPGSGNCEADTTVFDVEVVQGAQAMLSLESDEVCLNDCVTLNLDLDKEAEVILKIFTGTGTHDGREASITREINSYNSYQLCISGNFGATSNDTIFYDNTGLFYSVEIDTIIDPNGCPTVSSPPLNLDILTSWNETKRGTVCVGKTVNIDGKEYGASVTEEHVAANGCDSIINIVIDTFPFAMDTIIGSYCEGTPVPILNMVFAGPTDEIAIFPGQSVFGCDSIALVQLTFTDKAVGNIDTTVCEGNAIEIDGTSISDEGLTEIDFAGGSVAGCDSSTMVTLRYADAIRGTLDTTLCSGETLMIDGIEITSPIQTEIESSQASISGCDSITLVNVAFTLVDTIEIIDQLCLGETIDLFGTSYDENTLPQEILFSDIQGCDSILYELDIEIFQDFFDLRVVPICDEDDPVILQYYGSYNKIPLEIYVNGILDTVITTVDIPINLKGFIGMNTVTIDGFYCSLTRTVDVNPPTADEIELIATETSPNSYDLGFSYPDSLLRVEWSGSENLSCTICPDPKLVLFETTEITVSIITVGECILSQSIILEVDESAIDATSRIYEPTAINLNEANNDIFFLQSGAPIEITDLRIYDRWGNLVFENQDFMTNDSSQGWDGRFLSQQVEQGVYVYQFSYEIPGAGLQTRLGNLTVIR